MAIFEKDQDTTQPNDFFLCGTRQPQFLLRTARWREEQLGRCGNAKLKFQLGSPSSLSITRAGGRYLDQPLTVIAEPTEAMGRCAAELLLARLNSRSTSRKLNTEIFPPELIVRNRLPGLTQLKPAADRALGDEIKKSYPDLQIVDNRIGNTRPSLVR